MVRTDVLIIGGGPAGSACAWRLRQNNVDCIILDQHAFPRLKPCAGWITPEVVRDLNFLVDDYPYSFTTFRSFQIAIKGFKFRLPAHQHAIRRYEFDDWLVRRSKAPFIQHAVKAILQDENGFKVDGEYTSRYLVGAGGTHCPVYRTLFEPLESRPKSSLIVAQEEEFAYPYTDSNCYLWFLENRLPGYAWYVPKANGYVNVGVGGKAEELKANGDSLKNHWNLLVKKLETSGLIQNHTYKPAGHSYYIRSKIPAVQNGNAFIVGDAVGLATLDMGEGISPAIKSGLLAADAILLNKPYSVASIPRYSLKSLIRLGFA
jgi:flavin-dependent dehydrogenase